jgi:cation diffusion facilitator CzcD-associated flavoprotein CzcO
LEYLQGVAAKWNLYRYARFNSAVEAATWDDEEKKWKVSVKVTGGKDAEYTPVYTISADYLVSGMGQLNEPSYPSIPGLDSFERKVIHSARWDWSYPMEGKRIGIIGNGATAAQAIPELAKVAKSLVVFQRTPNWVVPRMDKDISPFWQFLYSFVPPVRKLYRAALMDFREGLHESISKPGSKTSLLAEQAHEALMKAQLPNRPDLWEKLTPDYPTGCKRVIISDDIFPALGLPSVTLETNPIEAITPKGVKVKGDKEHEFDLIVLATGFRTVDFMYPVKITGRNGRSISDIWKSHPRALYGVGVEDLPNFGMLYGPNTNLGHNSIILMIETQSRYITTMINTVLTVRATGKTLALTPKTKRVREFNDQIQEILGKTSFADPRCSSWYKTKDNVVTNNWWGTVVDYQKTLRLMDWNDYDAEGSGAEIIGEKKNIDIGRIVEESRIGLGTLGAFTGTAILAAGAFVYRRRLTKRLL